MSFCKSIVSLLSIGFFINAFSENTMNIKFSPYWPEVLQNSPKTTAFDISIQTGRSIDRVVSFGAAFDFIWNKSSKKTKLGEHLYSEELIERSLLFPISGFLSISPLSDLPVSPAISGQAGIAFMHYKDRDIDMDTELAIPIIFNENGWYFGPFFKLSVDALINVGPRAALFLGPEYTWSEQKKIRRSDPHLFTMRDMSGFGLRFGVSAFF